EFRGSFAMAGDWKVVSQKEIRSPELKEPLDIGVRKRKYEGAEEGGGGGEGGGGEEAGEADVKRSCGSKLKNFPGDQAFDPSELQSLLSSIKAVKKGDPQSPVETKPPEQATQCEKDGPPSKTEDKTAPDSIKTEEINVQPTGPSPSLTGAPA